MDFRRNKGEKNNKKTTVKFNNDQLGENASEEFDSEDYKNTTKRAKKE